MGHLRGVAPKTRIEFSLAEEDFARQADVVVVLMKAESFDVITFYTSWPDWFSHVMSLEDYDRAVEARFHEGIQAALMRCYANLDHLLERIRAARPDANIILLSDHGVGTGYKLRRRIIQHLLGCPGVFAAQGPDVGPSQTAPPVSMYDLTPTILAYFGVPLAQDFQGEARADILRFAQPPRFLASYHGAVPNRRSDKATEDTAAISERLKALGYIQ